MDATEMDEWVDLFGRISLEYSSPKLDILKAKICAKISKQMEQSLIVIGDRLCGSTGDSHRLMPLWMTQFLTRFPQFIPESIRRNFFLYSQISPSMSIHWMQENRVGDLLKRRAQIQSDLNTETSSSASTSGRRIQQLSQELSNIEERIVRNNWWFGSLKFVLAKLQKSSLFSLSRNLMDAIASSPSLLEIQFEGETGFGSAVTRSFFGELAKEFTSIESVGASDMWIANEDDTMGETAAAFIRPGRRGLLIKPLKNISDKIEENFRLLGQLMARAIIEGYIVPLPIPVEIFEIIRDPTLDRPTGALPLPDDGIVGEFVGGAAMLVDSGNVCDDEWTRIWAGTTKSSAPIRRLADSGAIFLVTGFSGSELIDGGAEIPVDLSNVSEFVRLGKQWYLYDGIDAQIRAVRCGINDVFSVENLRMFTADELRSTICGEELIDWDEESLKKILVFHDSVNEISDWLIQALIEFDHKQRSTFLDFVTSCPRLPPGGTGSLRIDVFPEHIASSNVVSPVIRPVPIMPPEEGGFDLETGGPSDGSNMSISSEEGRQFSSPVLDGEVVGYPRSRACVNHLYLPRYRARETLKERLVEAMVSSVHHDEITS